MAINSSYELDSRGAPEGLDISCGIRSAERPAVVHEVDIPGPGTLSVHATGHFWDAVVAIRSSCEGEDLACAREEWPDAEAHYAEATTALVVVGGLDLNIDRGPYTLELAFELDEGPMPEPEPEPQPATCDEIVNAELPLDTIVSGSTDEGDDHLGPCFDEAGPDGVPEVVYSITTGRGLLSYQAESEEGFEAVVRLVEACDGPLNYCPTFTDSRCVEAGTHYLVVSGKPWMDVNTGAFDVWASLVECGEGEECEWRGCSPPPLPEDEDGDLVFLQGADDCEDAPELPIGDTAQGTFSFEFSDLYYRVALPERGELHTWVVGVDWVTATYQNACDDVGLGACREAGECIIKLTDRFDPWIYDLTTRFHRCLDGTEFELGQCRRSANVQEVEPNDRGIGAQPLVHGDTVAGDMRWGTTDYYTVDLLAGQVLSLDIQTGWISVFVYSSPLPDPPPSGHSCMTTDKYSVRDTNLGDEEPFEYGATATPGVVCTNHDGALYDGPMTYTAPADGTYYLRVIGNQYVASDTYEISVDVE